MYFSLITPTPGYEKDAAYQWAQGPYEQHQWLWQFLPAERGSERDFLFRRRDTDNSLPGYYLLSKRMPHTFSEAWEVHSKDFNPQLSQGRRFAFELRANPVVSHTVDGKSRRDDVVMHAKRLLLKERNLSRWVDWDNNDPEKPQLYDLVNHECINWMIARGPRCGFRLVNNDNDEPQVQVHAYTQQKANKKNIRFSTVDYSGCLEVSDVQLFKETLGRGIGHAKAFGCGLLLIKPA